MSVSNYPSADGFVTHSRPEQQIWFIHSIISRNAQVNDRAIDTTKTSQILVQSDHLCRYSFGLELRAPFGRGKRNYFDMIRNELKISIKSDHSFNFLKKEGVRQFLSLMRQSAFSPFSNITNSSKRNNPMHWDVFSPLHWMSLADCPGSIPLKILG